MQLYCSTELHGRLTDLQDELKTYGDILKHHIPDTREDISMLHKSLSDISAKIETTNELLQTHIKNEALLQKKLLSMVNKTDIENTVRILIHQNAGLRKDLVMDLMSEINKHK